MRRTLLALAALAFLPAALSAQLERVQPNPEVSETRNYEGLAEGPYEDLLIRNVMVLPGHGGPGQGPADIHIRGNVIESIREHDPDREVEAEDALEDIGDALENLGAEINTGYERIRKLF